MKTSTRDIEHICTYIPTHTAHVLHIIHCKCLHLRICLYFQLRRKEEIRLKAEKIRRRAEKYAQSKAMKKLMKEVC